MEYFSCSTIVDNNNFNHLTSINVQHQNSGYDYTENLESFHQYDPRLNCAYPEYNLDLCLKPKNILGCKTDDELWIETWLSKIGKIHINLDTIESKTPDSKAAKAKRAQVIPIHAAKYYLKSCIQTITRLRDIQDTLGKHVSTMTSSEWKKRMFEIGAIKDEFSSLISHFGSSDAMQLLSKSLKHRKKKRISCKRRKWERKKLLANKFEVRRGIQKDIDQWLINMKDAVERTKMEEIMKKDADCVLSEVNKKKSEARKQLALLNALSKLRTVRENTSIQRGENISLEDRNAFSRVTESLTKMWENSLQMYTKEEQGLKMMLEQNAAEDSLALQVEKEKKIIEEWNTVMFGPKIVPSPAYWGLTSAEKNFETFIAMRQSWDTFLVPQNNPEGSRIPIGWVLPNASASDSWTSFLQTV